MKQNGFKFQTMASQSCDPQTASRLRAPGETGASVAVALDLLLFLLFLTIALSEMKIRKLGQKGHAFQESVAKERVFLRSSWTLSPPSGRTESRKRVLSPRVCTSCRAPGGSGVVGLAPLLSLVPPAMIRKNETTRSLPDAPRKPGQEAGARRPAALLSFSRGRLNNRISVFCLPWRFC